MIQGETKDENVNSTNTKIDTTEMQVNQIKKTITKSNVQDSNIENFQRNTSSNLTLDDVGRVWTEILEKFKAKRAMIVYASIVTAKPYSFKDGVVTLEYEAMYAFNKERLQKSEYRDIVNAVFSEALNEKILVDYVVKKDKENKNKEELLKQTIDGIPFEVYDE